MVVTRTLYDSAAAATGIFRTFEEGEPDLVDLGLGPVSRVIGGVFGGNLVGIAAAQNVGKSSMLACMGHASRHLGGVISLEDGEDVWGARLLARWSDVPPTKIRRKALQEKDLEDIRGALVRMREASEEGRGPLISYAIGGSVDDMEKAVESLARAGCRWIALDYLQKPRGHHQDRRSEVGVTMNRFHRACAQAQERGWAKAGVVPVIMSQIVRLRDGQEPFPSHMKESGDIENECRMIIMLWRDPADESIVRGKVAKSSFGGGGLRFAYKYSPAEYLVEMTDTEEF